MTDKEKIKAYIELKGISRRSFYLNTGLSNGFLDRGESFSVDNFRKMVECYPDLNPLWVLLDKEPIILSPEVTADNLFNNSIDHWTLLKDEFESFKSETEMALNIILEELDSIDGKKLREKIDLAIKKSDEQQKKGA